MFGTHVLHYTEYNLWQTVVRAFKVSKSSAIVWAIANFKLVYNQIKPLTESPFSCADRLISCSLFCIYCCEAFLFGANNRWQWWWWCFSHVTGRVTSGKASVVSIVSCRCTCCCPSTNLWENNYIIHDIVLWHFAMYTSVNCLTYVLGTMINCIRTEWYYKYRIECVRSGLVLAKALT